MKKKNENIDDDYVELDLADDAESTVVPELVEKERKKSYRSRTVRRNATDEEEDEEDDEDEFEQLSFRNIIGGDILQSKFFLSKVVFIIFCVILMVIYTGNGYGSLNDIIEINKLKKELNDVHYEVLTQSGDLMNMKRQSNVEKRLYNQGDTMMLNNNTPPFALPEEE